MFIVGHSPQRRRSAAAEQLEGDLFKFGCILLLYICASREILGTQ